MIKCFYSFIEDFNINLDKVDYLCDNRKDYVEKFSDNRRKVQSVLVWKLLRFALKEYFNNLTNNFICSSNGWQLVDNSAFFSITHSDKLICVAISVSDTLGVDGEKCTDKILKVKKLFANECFDLNSVDELTLAWTKKESNFKNKNGKLFNSKKVYFNNEEYFISVCSNIGNVEFEQIDFDKLINYTL